jgi:hypothetical protein
MLADTPPFVMPDTSSCATASPAAWIWPAAVLEPPRIRALARRGHDRHLAGTLWSPVTGSGPCATNSAAPEVRRRRLQAVRVVPLARQERPRAKAGPVIRPWQSESRRPGLPSLPLRLAVVLPGRGAPSGPVGKPGPKRSFRLLSCDAQPARLSGCVPIPVPSERTDRHRLALGADAGASQSQPGPRPSGWSSRRVNVGRIHPPPTRRPRPWIRGRASQSSAQGGAPRGPPRRPRDRTAACCARNSSLGKETLGKTLGKGQNDEKTQRTTH